MSLFRVHPLDAPIVALAIDATGTGPDDGELRSVAAVKFHAGRVIDRLESSPAEAPLALSVLVGDAPIVGHGLSRSVAFLATAGVAAAPVLWDLSELAALLMPGAADTSLESLAGLLGVPPLETSGGSHAAAHANLTSLVYLALIERARAEPAGLLRRLADLLYRSHSALADLVTALAEAPSSVEALEFGEASNAGQGRADVNTREVAARLERPRPIGSPKPPQPLDLDEITRLLSGDGPFARRFPRYEPRLEQIAMARAVAEAFGTREDGEPHHLVVEGGTGIGKSVAYLLPAVLFSVRNNVRVVVSTNTINLQDQLIAKDIPDLMEALSEVPGLDITGFRFSQMKGKANYLCMRRWEAMANSDQTAADEAALLAKTLPWLRETRTGDRAELGLRGQELRAWDRMAATNFGVCNGAREGACFYRHARDRANAAHLVVVNHALLMSDMQVEGTVLPDYDYLIVDEAHNLEEEATRQFGFHVSETTVQELVERLGAVVHSLTSVLRVSPLTDERKDAVRRRLDEAQIPLYAVRDTWARLVAGLTVFAADERESGEDGEVRITMARRAQPAWSELEIAWDEFERAASEAASRADSLQREADELPVDVVPGLETIKGELAEWTIDQQEARARIAAFVSTPDEQTVYWIGRGGGTLSLNGAPLEVGSRLNADLFTQKQAVVLTSATLAVRGGFAHVRGRLGVEDIAELCLGSPFDYRTAALLCLPTDVPEPSVRGYGEAVAQIIGDLAAEARGHTMALFTSHAAVRSTAAALRRRLPRAGIRVMAQAVDGTPQQLVARFQENPESVLLGTSSFWEGVDIANNALRVLVVARLPFNVPTEPVFAARSDLYEQPFMQFAVPQAVLRFRQGFGRLIRNKQDRGVVVVLDSRITSKPYGGTFLASVPPATTLKAPMAEVIERVRDWRIGGGPA